MPLEKKSKNCVMQLPALASALILTIALCVLSCKSTKPITNSTTEKTSTEIRYERHDSIVYVPSDSSLLRLLIECDSLGKARVKTLLDYQAGQQAKIPTVKIDDNNVLTTRCECDSLSIYLTWWNKFYESRQESVKPVNYLTKWQKMQIKGFWLCLLVLVLTGGYKVLKWYLKIKK